MNNFRVLSFLLFLLFLLASSGVAADNNIKLTYNFFTSHSDTSFENDADEEVNYNNNNKLIGISYQYDENSSIGFGYMESNSYYEESYLINWDNWIRASNYIDLGIDLAYATGYERVTGEGGSGRIPIALPYLRFKPFGGERVSVKIGRINLFMGTVGFVEFNFDI